MTTQTYLIAGHAVSVSYDGMPCTAAEVAPSFQPFLTASVGKAVLSVKVDTVRPQFADDWRKVISFPMGDGEYVMYQRDGGGVAFVAQDVAGNAPRSVAEFTPDFHDAHISLLTPQAEFPLVFRSAMMLAYVFATSGLDTLVIHSSVVKYMGRAYMFLGKSGTGKSTHSQSWLRNFDGCELMNDDNPIIRLEGESTMAYGSPWSGKTPCYKQMSAQIGGMVGLVQAKENKIHRLDATRGFVHLFTSVSTMICHSPSYHRIMDTVLRLAERVPIYELENLPNDDAARLCRSTIVCPREA